MGTTKSTIFLLLLNSCYHPRSKLLRRTCKSCRCYNVLLILAQIRFEISFREDRGPYEPPSNNCWIIAEDTKKHVERKCRRSKFDCQNLRVCTDQSTQQLHDKEIDSVYERSLIYRFVHAFAMYDAESFASKGGLLLHFCIIVDLTLSSGSHLDSTMPF